MVKKDMLFYLMPPRGDVVLCRLQHDARKLGKEEKKKKTSAEKRKNRSGGSKWRRGTGEAQVARSQAWRATSDESIRGYWV